MCVYLLHVCKDHTLTKLQNVKNGLCRVWHLPSNGIIAKIAFRALDLLFEGQRFFNIFIYLKRYELAQKFVVDICRFWPLPSNDDIAIIAHRDLDILLNVTNLNFLYRWKGKIWNKNLCKIFVDFDICHLIVKWRKFLHSVTLTYPLNVTFFQFLYLKRWELEKEIEELAFLHLWKCKR